jgi:hypothetical protein
MKPLIAVLAGLASALSLAAPAEAERPGPISSPNRLRGEMGAIRLSVQSQVQLTGPLYIWFLREGGDPARDADLLRFTRGQGVPVLGSNMVDSRAQVFAVRPGRYRLIAHSKSCSSLPPPGAFCSAGGPTERYEGETPVFEVRAGQVTDVGEFILEAPAGTAIGEETGMREMASNPLSFRFRVRTSEQPWPAAFAAAPRGPAVEVPAAFRSSIRCRARPDGAMMYLPFDC